VDVAIWLKLDRLRIMAGQNWLALHNTPTVSAHQKWADWVFRFEYGEHFLAVQRIAPRLDNSAASEPQK